MDLRQTATPHNENRILNFVIYSGSDAMPNGCVTNISFFIEIGGSADIPHT